MTGELSWRLYLPAAWVEDAARKAGTPFTSLRYSPPPPRRGKIPAATVHRTKNELALELIDQALGWELPRLPIVTDSAYGKDCAFRAALRTRGLHYAVAVEPSTKVWTSDPQAVALPPPKARGRPRHRPPRAARPARDLAQVARALPASAWRTVHWRHGSKGAMISRLAKVPVWAAHRVAGPQTAPRAAEWLLIEWPAGAVAPSDYWLCQLDGMRVGLRRLIRVARARWRVEMDCRELKEELGLDHYEGRHWLGWQHHVTLVSMAFAFLLCEQAHAKKNFWCDVAADPAGAASGVDPPLGPLPVVPLPL